MMNYGCDTLDAQLLKLTLAFRQDTFGSVRLVGIFNHMYNQKTQRVLISVYVPHGTTLYTLSPLSWGLKIPKLFGHAHISTLKSTWLPTASIGTCNTAVYCSLW